MKRKVVYSILIILVTLLLCGSIYVDDSFSASTYEINKLGSFYIPKGTIVKLNGISCSSTYDYTSIPFKTLSDNTCGSSSFTMNTLSENYLLVLKENKNSCSSVKTADCYIYEYESGSASIGCNKNNINVGESASCTLKVKTSSDGMNKISFELESNDLVIQEIQTSMFTSIEDGNKYTFVSNVELAIKSGYIVAAFNLYNKGESDGISNTAKFNNITFSDDIATLNFGSSSLAFTEKYAEVTKKEEKVSVEASPKTDDSVVITEGISEEVVDTGDKRIINGASMVLLVVFIVMTSIALGIGIVLLNKEKKE